MNNSVDDIFEECRKQIDDAFDKLRRDLGLDK